MESIKQYRVHDPMDVRKKQDIMKCISNEMFLYSDKITKVNRFNINQERTLLLTNEALYNFKKTSLKRRIAYKSLLGISLSKVTYEFIIHGLGSEYDYYYLSNDRGLIISTIAKNYKLITGKNLNLYVIDLNCIKKYVTSKKDKDKKGDDYTKIDGSFLVDTDKFIHEIDIQEGLIRENSNSSEGRSRVGTIFSKHKTAKVVQLSDFETIKVIGRGSFGKVCLVQYKQTKEYFAMKSLKKDIIIDQDQVENILTEKKILQTLNHPFLVGMVFCFQTVERIYFVMPFVRGGELFQHLRNFKYFGEEQVKFYAATIGLALDYLHNKNIVYRDIKPENILVDEFGYLKLVDFGMAKTLQANEKATSFCGTPEYLAPEIILGESYDKGADWWSFGILMFELLYGLPPFYNENTEKMYNSITKTEVKFPKRINVSDECKDLIMKALEKDPTKRIGSQRGFDEMKEHPWFKGFDFDALMEKKIKAPFIPVLKNETDVRNFDTEFTSEELVQSLVEEKSLKLIKQNQNQFADFDL